MELIQLVLAIFISKDIEFYDPVTNEKAQVNATNLADELGQIEFLFSDKTGTLTQNKMVFKCYGLVNEDSVYDLEEDGLYMVRNAKKLSTVSEVKQSESPTSPSKKAADYFSSSSEEENTEDVLNMKGSDSSFKYKVTDLSNEAERFWTNVALCHTIEAKVSTDAISGKEVIKYNAASPDEMALVDAATRVGFTYIGIDDTVVKGDEEFNIHMIRFDQNALNARKKGRKLKTRRYRVDAVLEFNSVRKRMSVMAREEDGRCFVYTKGAEVSMLDPRRCEKTSSNAKDDIMKKVTDFALSGLRTLVFGYRELDVDTYNALLRRFRAAQCLIGPERVRRVEEASAEI
ncbi:unnamed protein product, partial [Mesocestoides corti]